MSDSDDGSLPISEDRLRKAIVSQIEKFGMEKLTSRVIRENLKAEFGHDFTQHKTFIDKVTMDIIQNRGKQEKKESKHAAAHSESNSDNSDSEDDAVFTDKAPIRKSKAARKRATPDSDSELLEVGQKRRRAAAPPKKTVTKRKKEKDAEEGGSKPRRKNGYSSYCALSDELAGMVGKQYMRRSDVVKTMWAYFRSNNLLDPKDKRFVLSDEPLMKLFKKKRFLAFGMMKDLSAHITEGKFLNEDERAALAKYEEEEDARQRAEGEQKNGKTEERHSAGTTEDGNKSDSGGEDGRSSSGSG